MHSFAANRNSTHWLIETHSDIAPSPDDKTLFKFEVAARRVAAGEGLR